jgi:hypothetical protein
MKQMMGQRQQRLRDFGSMHDLSPFSGLGFSTFTSVNLGNSTQVFYLSVNENGFRLDGFPSILTASLNSTKVDSTRTTDWVAGLLSIQRLVEYNDTNGDGLFTPGADTALQVVNFNQLTWTLGTQTITSGRSSGYNITMTASYKGGTIEFIAQIFNTGVVLSNGVPVSPSEVKADFIFNHFPWNSTTSRLALFSAFGGVAASSQVSRADNQTTAVSYKNAFAYFTWASTATVDGASVPVVSNQTSINNGAIQEVQLNYPHGNNITDDPIIGVGSGSTENIPSLQVSPTTTAAANGLPGLYFIAATAVVILGVAALTLVARKRMVEPKLQF